MTWLRIEDGFVEHPKISDLSDRAFRLHMAGLCYCARNLTDGLLTVRATKVVCALANASRRQLVELRDAGLWLPEGEGWLIRDYLEYNPPAEEVKRRRSESAARQRRWRDSHRAPNGSFDAPRNALHNAAPDPGPTQTPVEPSRPVANIESVGAAIALCEAIPDIYKDPGTRKVILAYAGELEPADFHSVQAELEARDDVRNAAKWVNGALKRRAIRKAAA